ncbi:DNA repair protein RecN [Solemya velesiana gill symbiont]|uniref:DNA repair protein RecN n=1 Tax=Solemya velesiana gill symbiont TaxID=1918948 RepID=A0A1T2KTQ6_9GAMM|nr:DNA repair protein RecN [Solemya velesiana gill symbiont]OOZ36237.1 DNA repair protein RecN [Solemya velesiana gill symbiont]
MLTSIHIQNLAIVTTTEVEFERGLIALTGETGAGKSILIDALGLTLGDRADNNMIRNGCDRAEISAHFNLSDLPEVRTLLEEQALDSGDECLLRRVLVRDGNSKAFVNGSPVTARTLQSLGELLVDIHGQHAHQSLLRRDHQRELLDEYAGHQALCKKTATLYREWRETDDHLQKLREDSRNRTERLDLLRYQTDELEQSGPGDNEWKELEEEHARLSNAGRLRNSSDLILSILYDQEGAVQASLNRAIGELDDLLSVDPTLEECREMLESANIQIQEAVLEVRQYVDKVELDPARLDQVEQRLGELHDLARKYRCKPEELPARLEALQAELEELNNADIHLSELEQQTEALEQAYMESAEKLDKSRRKAAKKLGGQVTEGMQSLGMPDGRLLIEIESLPLEKASASGLNRVDMLVSANPGQKPQPLNKVASGGELSRISLAIQVATLSCGQIPTLIFDEVDVGIGGGVAEIVGRLLNRLGETRQVLCVTHLPQVAAQGHHHLQVNKSSNGKGTRTEITQLSGTQRVEEIARMLGGVEITDQTLAHAQEMLGQSRQ